MELEQELLTILQEKGWLARIDEERTNTERIVLMVKEEEGGKELFVRVSRIDAQEGMKWAMHQLSEYFAKAKEGTHDSPDMQGWSFMSAIP